MALLEGLRSEFADHDAFVYLLLGLVSASGRLGQLLPEASRSASIEPAPSLSEEEEARVLLLLGLISVQRTLMGRLQPLRAAQDVSASTGSPETPRDLPSSRELLR